MAYSAKRKKEHQGSINMRHIPVFLLLLLIVHQFESCAASSPSSSEQYAAAASIYHPPTTASTSSSSSDANASPSTTTSATSDVLSDLDTPISSASTASPLEAVAESSVVATSKPSSPSPLLTLTRYILSNPRLANLRERALPAVVLLAGLYVLVQSFGEQGLQLLLVILSPGLYHEAVSVALPSASTTTAADDSDASLVDSPPSTPSPHQSFYYSNRWWWFLSYSLMLTVPTMLPILSTTTCTKLPSTSILQLFGFTGTLLGWMHWIVHLNQHENQPLDTKGESTVVLHFQKAWKEVTVYHMSILFTLLPVSCWLSLLREGHLSWTLYVALLVVWNDTSAYLVGHFFGKRPLLPIISPKKTMEGFVGALLLTLALSPVVWTYMFGDHPYSRHAFGLAAFCSLVAPFGGFLGSTLKRANDQKDFGTLIAGHGGLVDRLDCQLVAAPFLYFYLKVLYGNS